MDLSENWKPCVKIENESGKSSVLLSLTFPIWTYLRHDRLAKFGGVEFSDTPQYYFAH